MKRAVAAALGAALVLVACSDAEVPRRADATCPIDDGESTGRAVLRCTDGTVAYVETSVGSGTGVVVELDGRPHLLTNAHVVDPFAAADVVLGEDEFESVPVLGVDAAADIAVLGPLDDRSLPTLRLGTSEDLARGDEVFLVGFPGGESDTDDIETTIASGIVSRRRHVEEFGQTYLQTDASISGGQSGGPLFDRIGRLVGISGLSYADEFALVLSAEDVREAVDRILDGDGDDYVAVPPTLDDGGGELEGSLHLAEAADGQVLFLPADDVERTWNFELDPAAQVTVAITDALEYELLAQSGNSRELDLQAERDALGDDAVAPEDEHLLLEDELEAEVRAREVGPRRFRIPVEAGHAAEVWVRGPLLDAPTDVTWRSDQPVVPLSRPVREVRLDVGDEEDFVINAYDTSVDVLLDLDAGDRVLLHARSPQGDPSLTILRPDIRLDHVTAYDPEAAGAVVLDDSRSGLYGTDARGTFEAASAGTHRIRVYSYDGTLSMIRLSITPCGGIVDCDAGD